MVLMLLITAVILSIAFYQALQGLFSALLMAILTVLCAAVAVNLYEPVASAFLYTRQPAYADAAALTALFVLPMLGLRIGVDKLISGNVVLPRWLDRVGGGLVGLLTGTLMAGVFALVLQMLPFGPSILWYEPFDDSLRPRHRLWPFCPDQAVIGLGRMVSGGSFSGQRWFGDLHDDLRLELFCARNRPERVHVRGRRGRERVTGRAGRFDAFPGYLRVMAAYECPSDQVQRWCRGEVEPLLREEPLPAGLERQGPRGPRRMLVVRVAVDQRAREERDAGELRNWWMLPGTQFRLVSRTGRSYYPVGYLTHLPKDGQKARREARRLGKDVKPQDWLFIRPRKDRAGDYRFTRLTVERLWDSKKNALTVDWVFRLPRGEVPSYMVFRRVARSQVPRLVVGEQAAEVLFSEEFAKEALGRRA